MGWQDECGKKQIFLSVIRRTARVLILKGGGYSHSNIQPRVESLIFKNPFVSEFATIFYLHVDRLSAHLLLAYLMLFTKLNPAQDHLFLFRQSRYHARISAKPKRSNRYPYTKGLVIVRFMT